MSKVTICFFIFLIIYVVSGVDFKSGMYRIQNVAHSLDLTVQGVNASFATVVGELYQNVKEQKWEIKKAGKSGYELVPGKFRSNNVITYFKDPKQKYANPEIWGFNQVAPAAYHMENRRTKNCLASGGRRVVIVEAKCDKFAKNQQWTFIPI